MSIDAFNISGRGGITKQGTSSVAIIGKLRVLLKHPGRDCTDSGYTDSTISNVPISVLTNDKKDASLDCA